MKKLWYVILLFFGFVICNAQPVVIKRYSTPGNTNYPVYSISTHSNGDFVVSSVKYSSGKNNTVVMRVDSMGNILWSNEFSTLGDAWSTQNISNPDGGNIISSRGLIKIDAMGNILWSKLYLSDTIQNISYINSTKDGGLIISGAKSHNPKNAGIIIKIDSSGDILWAESFVNDSANVQVDKTIEMPSGEFLTVGTIETEPLVYHPFIWKVDSSGNSIEFKVFNLVTNYAGFDPNIYVTPDSGYIFTASFKPISSFAYFGVIAKFNRNDSLQWSKRINQNHVTFNFGIMNEGVSFLDSTTFIIGGGDFNNFTNAVNLLKIDLSGNLLWSKKVSFYLGREFRFMSFINNRLSQWIELNLEVNFITSDSSLSNACFYQSDTLSLSPYLLTGTLMPNIHQPSYEYDSIIQFTVNPISLNDSTLCLSLSVTENYFERQNVFPNPFYDNLTLTVNNNDPSQITLYDLTSRKILQQSFNNTTSINTTALSKGLYLYEVRNKNGVIKKGKLVKD